MAMKCQKCGAENPEQVEFCTECGGRIEDSQSAPIQPRKSWVGAYRDDVRKKAMITIIAVSVAVISAFAFLVVFFAMPICELTVLAENSDTGNLQGRVHVAIYLDGQLMDMVFVERMNVFVGPYKVVRGTHTVGLDYSFSDQFDIDGVIDIFDSFEVTWMHPGWRHYYLSPP